jgi:hypothetical protein
MGMTSRSSRSTDPKESGSRALFDLLAHLDELESLRDQMDELGIRTREELEECIATLEAEAVKLEHGQ